MGGSGWSQGPVRGGFHQESGPGRGWCSPVALGAVRNGVLRVRGPLFVTSCNTRGRSCHEWHFTREKALIPDKACYEMGNCISIIRQGEHKGASDICTGFVRV